MTATEPSRNSILSSQLETDSLQNHSPYSHTTNLSVNSREDVVDPQAGRKRRQSEIDDSHTVIEGGVRRRISRACDQCNQLRRKCDGQQPCAYCLHSALPCSYTRAHKKRGRVGKKEHQQRRSSDHVAGEQELNGVGDMYDTSRADLANAPPSSMPTQYDATSGHIHGQAHAPEPLFNMGPHATSTTTLGLDSTMASGIANRSNAGLQQQPFSYGDHAYPMSDPPLEFGSPFGDIYSVAFMGKAPMIESPDWLAASTPQMLLSSMINPVAAAQVPTQLRFPVLQPLMPYLDSILSPNQACELLEQYFASSSSTFLRPSNAYVLGFIFRKASILHETHPRPCSPALLSSMLWVVAQVSDAAFLTTQLNTRAKICQKLLRLTITLLRPLIHNSTNGQLGEDAGGDAGLNELVGNTTEANNAVQYKAQIDNLVTYVHLATVVSASERKASSLRWWNAAWSLARELRLGRELPPDEFHSQDEQHRNTSIDQSANVGLSESNRMIDSNGQNHARVASITEEDREERRRTWWLLYMMDRHLALCYNRPVFLLNRECERLLRPMDDHAWQEGNFGDVEDRSPGLDIKCASHSIFGYFLPLMVILGEILDLNYARTAPRFGPRAGQPRNFDSTIEEITEQIYIFEASLHDFEVTETFSADSRLDGHQSRAEATDRFAVSKSERSIQTRTIIAYCRHIMHVLHILVTGKWDPIALLDDSDRWISSQSFIAATQHAVAAAAAVSDIIDYDPDLSVMPFFFGVYLLQGSFLLLLFADKLQDDMGTEVVRACETIVRAHEACVATLDTQYQRNFRRVMRSALQQVTGRSSGNLAEQQNRRREVLKLYRWTDDGTGLAL